MRLERLVVTGFGPFATRQEIDFRPLEAAGLFLITGRTGSGKSSILDAVCFALYGSAPRYDGTAARLRSDHAGPEDPTQVELEFVVAGERWRLVRSPDYERPKKRGTGLTKSPATATLERWADSSWAGVAARPVDVAEHLEPVLQLTREQFLQVILLAQGRFQDFLQARSEDRLSLLRALFGTERFARLEEELTQRARDLQAAVAGADASIAADVARIAELAGEGPGAGGAWAAAAAGSLRTAAADAESAERQADAAFRAADAGARAAAAVLEAQRRRTDALQRVAALEAAEAGIERHRARLEADGRARPLLPLLDAADRTRAAQQVTEADRRQAAAALPAPVADPAAAASAADADLGALQAPLREEQTLPAAEADMLGAARGVAAAEEALAAARDALASVPDRRRRLQQDRERALLDSGGVAEAHAAVERALAVLAAARESAQLTARAAEADAAHGRALTAEATAAARSRDLVAARIADAAGVLAAGLAPGSPCPVCGSIEHPEPAPASPSAVDDEALAAAERALDAAAGARRRASEAASAVRQSLAVALAAAAGITAVEAEALADGAAQELRRGTAASAEAERLAGELQRLGAQEAALAERSTAAEQALAAARDTLSGARQRRDAALASVAAARGEHGSVAASAAAVRATRDLLRRLDATTAAAGAAARAAAERAAEADRALADAGFTDAAAARSVALPGPERAALAEAVQAHETALRVTAATLADPVVAAAPAEPVDSAAAEAAKAEALAARDAAADRRADAVARAQRGEALAEAVRAADAGVAGDRDRLAVLGPLAAVVKGDGANSRRMRLESFVLAARLEQIVEAANTRLAVMTDGRFALRHDDSVGYRNTRSGLGLEVLDEHTGRARPPASLSGGETFLASLALALGLAEVVSAEAGGVRLDTLFVDEGFGSLDRETLDTAMGTLDSLRAGGRVVGLISHVEAMQEDVPAGLHVERLPDGTSRIRPRA